MSISRELDKDLGPNEYEYIIPDFSFWTILYSKRVHTVQRQGGVEVVAFKFQGSSALGS